VSPAAIGGLLLLLLAAPPARASDPLAELKSDCRAERSAERNDPVRYRICTGFVPSFDGTPLDVTLTLPARRAPSSIALGTSSGS
jgi:hypothetical protein